MSPERLDGPGEAVGGVDELAYKNVEVFFTESRLLKKENLSHLCALLRNRLLSDQLPDEWSEWLDAIERENVESAAGYDLVRNVIDWCRTDIERGDLRSAGYCLDLIHNLPIGQESWSEEDEENLFRWHFPVFVENVGDWRRLRAATHLISSEAH